MAFCDWLFSLGIMFSKFVHIGACIGTIFLLGLNSIPFINIPCFSYSSVHRHLDCFCFGAVMKNFALDSHVHVFVWMYAFISLGGTVILPHFIDEEAEAQRC